MYQAPEQLLALNRANLEIAARFAGVALQGTERLIDVQLKAAREAFAESIENAKALASVKDVQQLAALRENVAQPSLEKVTSYAKSVYDAAATTQAELGKLIEEQVADYNKQVVAVLDNMVKTAPAGSEVAIAAIKSGISAVNAAYDNFSKAAKQFSEANKSNFETVARQAAGTAKKAKRA